jgi:hypothetical protein
MLKFPSNVPAIAVPTATLIAQKQGRVLFFEPTAKHGGKLVLPGGRVEPPAGYRKTVLDEFDQEVGGKGAKIVAGTLKEWALKSDLYADVRHGTIITLGKLVHGVFQPSLSKTELETVSNLPVVGLYGSPDMIFTAEYEGEAHPSDGEAKRCVLVDPVSIKIPADPADTEYGAGHALYVVVWFLEKNGKRPLKVTEFADLEGLWQELVDWQKKFGF